MDLLLIGTLPRMVETPPQQASTVTNIPDESMKQMNSLDPSHCAKDPSPDGAQATSDEKKVSAAQKGVLKVYIHMSGARITITNLC